MCTHHGPPSPQIGLAKTGHRTSDMALCSSLLRNSPAEVMTAKAEGGGS